MSKMTTEKVLEIAEPVLAAPRRVRDIIERKLAAKRQKEDAGGSTASEGDGNVRPS